MLIISQKNYIIWYMSIESGLSGPIGYLFFDFRELQLI